MASCNGNMKEKGKRDSLGKTLVTGIIEDMGKVCACSSPTLGDGTAQSNSIFIQPWGLGRSGTGGITLWELGDNALGK